MKKYILTLTLASTLIIPLGVLAQDTGGGTPPPPPPDGGGGFQSQPPMNGGGFQPPMDGGGGFQPQPPMDGGGGFQPPIPREGQIPQGGQFPQGDFRQGNFPGPQPGQEGRPQGQFRGRTNFPGKGATEGQFPGQGMTEGQFPGGPEGQGDRGEPQKMRREMRQQFPDQSGEGEEFNDQGNFKEQGFEEQGQEDVVDAREIQQVQRQINDLKKQATRLLNKAKKNPALANEAAELQSFMNQLASYAESVRTGSRDALQDFYDAQIWETLNGFQARIEMPTEIARMEKDLTRLERLIAAKTFAVDGVDLGLIRSNIGEIRNAISGAKSALSSGDAESAREYLQVIYEGTNPGEIFGVLQQLREITKQLKRVRNADVKQAIIEIITPVYEAMAEGDFREANMALNEINRELFSILGKVRNSRTVNTNLRTKMRALEQKLEGRIQQIETQETQAQPGAFVPYKSSEQGLGSIISSVKNFFGF